MASRMHTVHISDTRRSIKYQRETIDVTDEGFKLRTHFSEEFVRFQEFSSDCWYSKYHYMLFCVLISNSNDVFPLLMQLALQLSGGTFLLLLISCSLIMGFPMVYMEAFLGRYTRLSNCQMYRMASMFFGICCVIFLLNILYQPVHVVQATELLVTLLKVLVNPGNHAYCRYNNGECYDYKINGSLNDTCRYKHFSMMCDQHGEIRYPMEFLYWQMHRDPDSTAFPYYQIITAVFITWSVILFLAMKGIRALGLIIHVSFLMQIGILTVIFLLALAQDGSVNGLKMVALVDITRLDRDKIAVILCYSVWRLGLIIPSGYMTFSAYARFESNLGTECFVIIALGMALAVYYLLGFCLVCGALSHAMGVTTESVFVHDGGLYLAMVPEFLALMQMPSIFLIIYYASLWFFETVKIALCIHMLALNLFDYFPTARNFEAYIWVTSCILLCFLSMPVCSQYFGTILMKFLMALYIRHVLMITVMLEATVVSFVYGIRRLCDDIHFMTGRKPLTYFRVMWYLIPFIGWGTVFIFSQNNWSVGLEDHSFVERIGHLEWIYAAICYWGLFVIGVLATIMYVIYRFGTPNLLLTLVKPQFFWGPPEVESRIDRKHFTPQTTIRSQFTYSKGNDADYVDNVSNQLIAQFSRKVLQDQIARGGVVKDKMFFPSIGIYTERETTDVLDDRTIEMQRDVDHK